MDSRLKISGMTKSNRVPAEVYPARTGDHMGGRLPIHNISAQKRLHFQMCFVNWIERFFNGLSPADHASRDIDYEF